MQSAVHEYRDKYCLSVTYPEPSRVAISAMKNTGTKRSVFHLRTPQSTAKPMTTVKYVAMLVKITKSVNVTT
ncbi:hypothetical protein V5799_003126 [Amblyomma americanum]|uniref:Uncharacterized protein n=1 Tax=Amblyomma americanum TaxID=6943 RepID=A0AAQ4D9V0_AMBAM